MSANSSIEWTDATWNPIVGCSIMSPGCTNCYAMKDAWRKSFNPATPHYAGLTKKVNRNAVWTGTVAAAPDTIFLAPLHWRKPKRVFVNSMGDLFHEAIPDEWIDRVFAVMALCLQHTFQVLTKRAERMQSYLTEHASGGRYIWPAVQQIEMPRGQLKASPSWPLPNVWLGISCERQEEADARIPLLLQTPAAKRFISAEPLLGPIDLTVIKRTQAEGFMRPLDGRFRKLDWVIAGGESGSQGRPMHPQWARDLRDQCQAAGVPFFFKQWGEWLCRSERAYAEICAAHSFERVGKKAAGRLLDGKEWNDFPDRQHASRDSITRRNDPCCK